MAINVGIAVFVAALSLLQPVAAAASIPSEAALAHRLGLERTPFGTYFKPTWTSPLNVSGLPSRFAGGTRALSSSIYNLYARDSSAKNDQAGFPLHCLQSDEAWNFYDGDGAIVLYEFDLATGAVKTVQLGVTGTIATPQYTVPALTWVGALLDSRATWVLTGSANTPAFDPRDSTMAADNKTFVAELYRLFPAHGDLLHRLLEF